MPHDEPIVGVPVNGDAADLHKIDLADASAYPGRAA